jgi:hypothetical protein
VRRQAGDVGAVEDDAAAVRRELPAELRHQRRLAGAVGADEGVDLAARDLQVDAIGRDQAAEALLEAAHVEQRRVDRGSRGGHGAGAFAARRARRPTSPWRAKRTTASSTQPVQNSQ